MLLNYSDQPNKFFIIGAIWVLMKENGSNPKWWNTKVILTNKLIANPNDLSVVSPVNAPRRYPIA